MDNIFNNAIIIIYKDEIKAINKIKGYNYHIEYFLKLSKSDCILKNVLKNYDVKYLKENPSEVLNSLIKDLNKNGACVLFSLAPHITEPTNIFGLCLASEINEYQISILRSIAKEELEFYDISIYNDEYIPILEDDDFVKNNGYVLDNYLDNLKIKR